MPVTKHAVTMKVAYVNLLTNLIQREKEFMIIHREGCIFSCSCLLVSRQNYLKCMVDYS